MIGASMITRGGLPQGLLFAGSCGCTAAQLYVAPSRAWAVPPLSPGDADLFRSRWHLGEVKSIVAHASLLLNLASVDESLRRKSQERLLAEMNRCQELGIPAIVVHPGSNPDRQLGIGWIAEGVDIVLAQQAHVRVLLENMAGQGNTIGATFDELAQIIAQARYADRLGVCIDTCHAFAAGYDLRGFGGYLRFIDRLERVVPLSSIGAFHVNDSKVELGRRVDRHAEIIGGGHIGVETFSALLRDERFLNVPMIAECPNGEVMTEPNVRLMHELRESLAPIRADVRQEAMF